MSWAKPTRLLTGAAIIFYFLFQDSINIPDHILAHCILAWGVMFFLDMHSTIRTPSMMKHENQPPVCSHALQAVMGSISIANVRGTANTWHNIITHIRSVFRHSVWHAYAQVHYTYGAGARTRYFDCSSIRRRVKKYHRNIDISQNITLYNYKQKNPIAYQLEEIFNKSRNFLTMIQDIVQPFCQYEKFLPLYTVILVHFAITVLIYKVIHIKHNILP